MVHCVEIDKVILKHHYCTLCTSGAGTSGTGGARAPPPTFPNGWARGGTVKERLITIIYCDMPIINAKNQE